MFDPRTQRVRLYYVPGDQNLTTGIAWDGVRKRIWFLNAAFPLEGLNAVPARLTSFDPERVPYDEYDGYLMPFPAGVTSFGYLTSDTCDTATGAALGVCSNNAERACLTRYDCVGVEHVCAAPAPGQPAASVADDDCYHEYPLPGVLLGIGVAVHPDGTIWFSNFAGAAAGQPQSGYGGRSLGQLDPGSGQVRYVALAASPDGSTPAPYDVLVAENGDVIASLLNGKAVARVDFRRFRNHPDACTLLSSRNPNDDCEIRHTAGSGGPPPSCTNRCVYQHRDTSAWTPCSGPDCPSGYQPGTVNTYYIGTEGDDVIWYSRGYVREHGSKPRRVYFPPLAEVYPPQYVAHPACVDLLFNDPTSGLGETVAVDRATGDVWGKTGCGYRLHRLRRLD